MAVSFSIHSVARVEVSAYSKQVTNRNWRMHCQTLVFFDSENRQIGEVVLFLEQPMSAMAIGDCSNLDGIAPVPAWDGVGEPF
jgi:hypothetical protein